MKFSHQSVPIFFPLNFNFIDFCEEVNTNKSELSSDNLMLIIDLANICSKMSDGSLPTTNEEIAYYIDGLFAFINLVNAQKSGLYISPRLSNLLDYIQCNYCAIVNYLSRTENDLRIKTEDEFNSQLLILNGFRTALDSLTM